MNLEITQKNYNANQRFIKVLESKLSKFEKLLDENDKIKVTLIKEGSNNYTMEISISIKNKIVKAAVTSFNMWDNIDLVLPKIERQISKTSEKSERKNVDFHATYPKKEQVKEHVIEKKSKASDKIVKEKKFSVSIITANQAIEEMEMLDHSFYIYKCRNNKVSVIYKRFDGNYGLITPEY